MKGKVLGLMTVFLLIGFSIFAADGDLIVNGNVGIGTVGPANKLDVSGTVRSTTETVPSGGIGTEIMYSPAQNRGLLVAYDRTANNYKRLDINDIITVSGGGGTGNVGIGTAGPGRKLEVAFSNTDDGGGIRLQNSATGGRLWGLTVAATGDVNSVPAGSLYLRDDSVGGAKLVVNTSGNVGIGTINPGTYKLYVDGPAYSTGGWWETSDTDFKENIAPIDSPLIKVLKMEGVSFNWRTGKDKMGNFLEGRRFGVIAQNIEGILPEAVKDGPDAKKAVAYTQIIPVLIEAIKEQQKQIEALKSEVAALKAQR